MKSLKFSKTVKKIIRVQISKKNFKEFLKFKLNLNGRFKNSLFFLTYFNMDTKRVHENCTCHIVIDTFSVRISNAKTVNLVKSMPILSLRFFKIDEPKKSLI